MSKKILYFLAVSSLFLFSGCAKYKPSQIPFPSGEKQKANNIKIVTRKLSDKEVKICFDSQKLSKKYDAVQIYVKNNSDKTIILNAQQISLPVISAKEICKTTYRETAARITSYAIPGFFLWPFWIPAIIDGQKSSKANEQIDQDVSVKVLATNDNKSIKPNNHINKIAFIPKGYNTKEFAIKLVDKNLKTASKFICNA